MTPEDNPSQPRSLADVAYQALLGVVFGLVLVMLLALCISLSTLEWRMAYIVILGAISMLCGLLAAVLGKTFLEPLIRFIESIPPIV